MRTMFLSTVITASTGHTTAAVVFGVLFAIAGVFELLAAIGSKL